MRLQLLFCSFCSFDSFDFINDLIGNNPDFYFSNDSNEDQIEILLPFIEKFSVNSTGFKETEKILLINRRKIFNKIIAIYMKIIFTKKRINKTPNIIKEFKNLLLNIDITKDLIETITEEINKIIDRSIGAIKIKTERKELINKLQYINNTWGTNLLREIEYHYYSVRYSNAESLAKRDNKGISLIKKFIRIMYLKLGKAKKDDAE